MSLQVTTVAWKRSQVIEAAPVADHDQLLATAREMSPQVAAWLDLITTARTRRAQTEEGTFTHG